MPIKPFGEYRPDLTDYEGQYSRTIANVVPRADGYGPFNDFTVFTAALAAACRGYFLARKSDGSVTIFAGTAATEIWTFCAAESKCNEGSDPGMLTVDGRESKNPKVPSPISAIKPRKR